MFKFCKDLIIVDLETSGVTDKASVIQLGAFRFSKEGVLCQQEYFDTYIEPYNEEWSEDAQKIHKLEKSFVTNNGAKLNEALINFSKWTYQLTNHKCYIAQWSCGFDTMMLKNAYNFAKMTYPFSYRSYDIASIVRFHLASQGKGNVSSLYECCRLMGLDVSNFKSHNALEDARYAGLCLTRYIENATKENPYIEQSR